LAYDPLIDNVVTNRERQMSTVQEYGSELNAVSFAFKMARENGIAGYAIECKYGWIASEQKPSLRFGKVYECQANGKKFPA
jgi:hypothetical protein